MQPKGWACFSDAIFSQTLDPTLYTSLLALWDFYDGLVNILSSFLKTFILSGKNWFKLPVVQADFPDAFFLSFPSSSSGLSTVS